MNVTTNNRDDVGALMLIPIESSIPGVDNADTLCESSVCDDWQKHQDYASANNRRWFGEPLTEPNYTSEPVQRNVTVKLKGQESVLLTKAVLTAKFHGSLIASVSKNSWSGQNEKHHCISLEAWDPDLVLAVFAWVKAPTDKNVGYVLSAENIISTMRLAHFLALDTLYSLCKSKISAAIDTTNASSILMMAEELQDEALTRTVVQFCVERLGAVEQEGAEFWRILPLHWKKKLHGLRKAALHNPLGTGELFADAKELLAVMKESLAVQTERFEEAKVSQQRYGNHSYGEKMLQSQKNKLAVLQAYIQEQQQIFNTID